MAQRLKNRCRLEKFHAEIDRRTDVNAIDLLITGNSIPLV
jgi:hypothetical protein